ncbi:MAG TPA: GAF domain-containing sensor histidine kinase [Anditalea sp.]|nr:GAF domain-containing sensor histidine kinase [Anditalea sp.]
MNNKMLPIPENEFDRLVSLSEFDLDYTSFNENFKDLTKLAAKVAGTKMSLLNLIDNYTQWSISNHNLPIEQMPREDSICQYTIMNEAHFEIKELSKDTRFQDRSYVKNGPKLDYYFGLPLRTENGHNLGALCVLDTQAKVLSSEKIELLKLIAAEIINRLKTIKAIQEMRTEMQEMSESKKKVAHDIRGPIGGIIGLAQLIQEKGDKNKLSEVLEFIQLIHNSGKGLLELADEILTVDYERLDSEEIAINHQNEFNLITLKEKIVDMYSPQAIEKNIELKVLISSSFVDIPFPKNKLLQIIGNLMSNAMKFTSKNGNVTVRLGLEKLIDSRKLNIEVEDTGTGMSNDKIHQIRYGKARSTNGTQGETGYGFGLALVKHLTANMNGTLDIRSEQDKGTNFIINLTL